MSLRARVLTRALHRLVRPQLRGEPDVAAMRAMFARYTFTPRGVGFAPARFGGIDGEAATTGGAAGRLFYIHGGGFVACSPRTHRALTGAFARRGFAVFAPAYRLAPEHPFPAALDDVVAAWRGFSAGGPAALAGDSAGGTLALGLMLRARAEGLAMPRAAALFSPGTDFLGTGDSLRSNAARDAMIDVAMLSRLLPAYVGAADPADPLLSPLYADLAGLPPLLLHVGTHEVLRDDSVRLAARAEAAGVAVQLRLFPHVPHVWQWADRLLPEARASLDEAAAFLRPPTRPA